MKTWPAFLALKFLVAVVNTLNISTHPVKKKLNSLLKMQMLKAFGIAYSG